MRTERLRRHGETHRNRSRVPARSREALEQGLLCRGVIEMHGLRIEFGREPLDLPFGDLDRTALEVHSERKVVKPLDHRTSRTDGAGPMPRGRSYRAMRDRGALIVESYIALTVTFAPAFTFAKAFASPMMLPKILHGL